MNVRAWAGTLVLAAAAWAGLNALEDDHLAAPAASASPALPSPPVSPSPTAEAAPDSPTPSSSLPPAPSSPPAPPSAPTAPAVQPREGGRAVSAAIIYLRTLRKETSPRARRHAVAHLLAPGLSSAPPLTDADPIPRVTGPGQVLAIDEAGTAAAVQVPTQTGTVFLELRRVAGRWLVAGLPAPD